MFDNKIMFSSIVSIIIATISFNNSFKLGIATITSRIKDVTKRLDEDDPYGSTLKSLTILTSFSYMFAEDITTFTNITFHDT